MAETDHKDEGGSIAQFLAEPAYTATVAVKVVAADHG
jgi:hypothetical protein